MDRFPSAQVLAIERIREVSEFRCETPYELKIRDWAGPVILVSRQRPEPSERRLSFLERG